MAKDNNQESSEKNKQQVTQPQASANRNVIFLGFFGIIFLIVVYYLYNALQGDNKSTVIPVPKNVATPPVSQDNSGVNIPQLPQVPKLLTPVEAVSDVKILPPPPPPPPIIAPSATAVALPKAIDQKSSDSALKEQNLAKEQKIKEENKRKAAIMAYGGAQNTPKQDDTMSKEAKVDDFADISKNAVTLKSAPEYLLTRGKIIDAIIEVPINSGIGGEIRAIISRDVYSQSGKVILIPKGSRAIGNYSTGVGKPVGVVNVNWERIDLVNGHVVKLTRTSGVNNLGMLGVNGEVDYKIAEQITKTLMSSAISIASAVGLDSIVPVASTVTTTTSSLSNTSAILDAYKTAQASDPVGTESKNAAILTALCNNVKPLLLAFAITNPVYATYINSLNSACGNPSSGDQNSINQFVTVMSIITNNGTVSLTDNSATSKAATQAYTDLNNTLKSIAGNQDTTILVTIPQGSLIKMYVGQDIEFPKTAIDRSR